MMTMRGGGEESESWPEMEAIARKMVEEVETESSGSSEAETESPRERVHSQVLKIREEDLSVLVEDKVMMNREDQRYLRPRRRNLFLISRQNRPCSPLSGKVTSVNAVQ